MASPEASLVALYAFSPLLSTSDARRSDPGDIHVGVKYFIPAEHLSKYTSRNPYTANVLEVARVEHRATSRGSCVV